MGVPGFYRWLIKKYKHKKFVFIKELLQDKNIIDELNSIDYYLIDANCLIHPVCFKTDNEKLSNNDNENNMLNAITDYLNKIIEYVNPKKGIYIAIDGVAPFAKIKQQRQRRFKSVADKHLWNNIKKKHNKPINVSWNNSSITPGTLFMDKLHKHILNWCNNLDKHVIYSSYLSPGEGEHKLLQFIRNNQLNNNDYSYVIYGLDADLIFLALSTNSNKMYLLRESNEINNDSSDILNYVSINIMREAIINTVTTFYTNKYSQNVMINFENNNIINDFIFMCYFLGNDFLPHIPSLDIHQNGIEYLINNYIDTIYEIFTEYNIIQYLILSCKKINLIFLEKLLKKLSLKEEEILINNISYKKNIYSNKILDNDYDKEIFKIENLQFKINDPIKLGYGSQKEWRIRYYKHYWNISDDELEEFSQKLVKHYFYGLKWITLYYFDKCPSWDWYYPFDHPPFISDIYKYFNNTKFNKITFQIGKPIKPLLQLLLVLPPQSCYLLPFALKKLVIENTPILYLYPNEFNQDLISNEY